MVRHFPILENSETELYVDPRNGRRNNTTRSALVVAVRCYLPCLNDKCRYLEEVLGAVHKLRHLF